VCNRVGALAGVLGKCSTGVVAQETVKSKKKENGKRDGRLLTL
jgi:hypothetical protein